MPRAGGPLAAPQPDFRPLGRIEGHHPRAPDLDRLPLDRPAVVLGNPRAARVWASLDRRFRGSAKQGCGLAVLAERTRFGYNAAGQNGASGLEESIEYSRYPDGPVVTRLRGPETNLEVAAEPGCSCSR